MQPHCPIALHSFLADDAKQAHFLDAFSIAPYTLNDGKQSSINRTRVIVFLQNTNKTKLELRFISSADGGNERKEAGKLISNMFIFFFSEAKGKELGGRKQ